MRFVAIDVETANPNMTSICQVGVVTFDNGQVVSSWESLVNPQDYFDLYHVHYIHGIDEDTVSASPTFGAVYPKLMELLDDQIVVCHMAFDRVSITRACVALNLPPPKCRWLDSAQVVRRAWPEFAYRGYGLANVAEAFDIQFNHHNALDDARVSGELILRAIAYSGMGLEEWLLRVAKPIDPERANRPISRAGNPEGQLYGEVLVFTGALMMPRQVAADKASLLGCEVASNVNSQTTLLVVGSQDMRKLAGHQKSSKHRKAEELIKGGQEIRILTEDDFLHLFDVDSANYKEMT